MRVEVEYRSADAKPGARWVRVALAALLLFTAGAFVLPTRVSYEIRGGELRIRGVLSGLPLYRHDVMLDAAVEAREQDVTLSTRLAGTAMPGFCAFMPPIGRRV